MVFLCLPQLFSVKINKFVDKLWEITIQLFVRSLAEFEWRSNIDSLPPMLTNTISKQIKRTSTVCVFVCIVYTVCANDVMAVFVNRARRTTLLSAAVGAELKRFRVLCAPSNGVIFLCVTLFASLWFLFFRRVRPQCAPYICCCWPFFSHLAQSAAPTISIFIDDNSTKFMRTHFFRIDTKKCKHWDAIIYGWRLLWCSNCWCTRSTQN